LSGQSRPQAVRQRGQNGRQEAPIMQVMSDTLSGVRQPCPVCGAPDGIVALRSMVSGQLPYFCLVCCWTYTQHLSREETRRIQERWPT